MITYEPTGKYEEPRKGRPWHEWFDGTVKGIQRGEDFYCTVESMRVQLVNAATKNSLKVKIHQEKSTERIIFQAYPQDQPPPTLPSFANVFARQSAAGDANAPRCTYENCNEPLVSGYALLARMCTERDGERHLNNLHTGERIY